MVRGLILQRKLASRGLLWLNDWCHSALFGISAPFGTLFPTKGQIIHALLTRAPLYSSAEADFLVRLACVRHAASVSSEPGSNSPVLILLGRFLFLFTRVILQKIVKTRKCLFPLFSFQRAFSKRALTYKSSRFSCQAKFSIFCSVSNRNLLKF